MSVTCPRCGRKDVWVCPEGRMVTHRIINAMQVPKPNCSASGRRPENAKAPLIGRPDLRSRA